MKESGNIIVECKPHWKSLIVPGILIVLFGITGISILMDSNPENGGAIVAFVIVLAAALRIVLWLNSGKLTMTENTISGKVGLIRTKEMSSPLSKVNDISVSSGLLGKIFKYYNVTVSTAGSAGAEYVFKNVTNGPKLQKEFHARVQ